MVRSYMKATLSGALVWAGVVAAQSPYHQGSAPRPVPVKEPQVVVPANVPPQRLAPTVVQTPAPVPAAKAPAPVPAASTTTAPERRIFIDEPGKPKQECRILRDWTTADGRKAMEVQALANGEIMTIVLPGAGESVATGGANLRQSMSRVFHWGNDHNPPPGAPVYTSTSVAGKPAPVTTSTASSQPLPAPTTTSRVVSSTPLPMPSGPVVSTSQPRPQAPVIMPPVSTAPEVMIIDDKGRMAAPNDMVAAQPARVPLWRKVLLGEREQPLPVVTGPDINAAQTGPELKADARLPESAAAKASAPTPAPRKPYLNPTQRGEWAKLEKEGISTSKPATAMAQLPPPTDIRQSWGKTGGAPVQEAAKEKPKAPEPARTLAKMPEPAKAPAVKMPEPAQTVAKMPAPAPEPVKTAAKPVEAPKVEAPKVEVNANLAKGQPKVELPKAEVKGGDPLMQPEIFSRRPEIKAESKPIDPNTPRSPLLSMMDTVKGTEKSKSEKVVSAKSAMPEKPGTASTHPQVPLGAGSVMAAYANPNGQVVYLPVPVVTMPDARRAPNAPQLNAPSRQPMGPVDDSMVNAFSGGPAVQAAYGQGMGNAFQGMPDEMLAMQQQMMMQQQMAAHYHMMAQQQMMQQQLMAQQAAAMGQPPVMMPNMSVGYQAPLPSPAAQANALAAQQHLAALKESLMPSHREWAADSLAQLEGQPHPQVVEALVTAAKTDLAGGVRAACIRALARMRVATPAVIAAVQALRADTDPRVRQEADQMLIGMGLAVKEVPAAVQPVSGEEPADAR